MFLAILLLLSALFSLVAIVALIRLMQLKKRFGFRPTTPSDKELPTVSVCIPARNETHAMTECLERVLASDYEKLEIIVLDDSSGDDTSMLIKSFAHVGVRFVEGSPLPDGWLGKNHALEDLLTEASGDYVVYMDVDTIVQPQSISRLVERAVVTGSDVVSVLPGRDDGARASVIFGTLRYFWVLFLASKRRPAVSGAVWLISREKLIGLGGFERYKKLVQPEQTILIDLKTQVDTQFLINNDQLGIGFEKKWRSQVDTSVRLLQPLFGGTFFSVGVALLLLLMVVVPALLVLAGSAIAVSMAVANGVLMTVVALYYCKIVWRRHWWVGGIVWPLVLVQEAWLIMLSIVGYARGSITWKGRPIENPLATK